MASYRENGKDYIAVEKTDNNEYGQLTTQVTEYPATAPTARIRPSKPPNYIPLAVRLWFIAFLLVLTLLLVGVIEILVRRLPTELDLRYPNGTIIERDIIFARQQFTDGGISIITRDPTEEVVTESHRDPTDFAEERTRTLITPTVTDVAIPTPTEDSEIIPTDFLEDGTQVIIPTDLFGSETFIVVVPTDPPTTGPSTGDSTAHSSTLPITTSSTTSTSKPRIYPTGLSSTFHEGYNENDLPIYTHREFTQFHYFAGQYSTTLTAIIFGLIWMFVYVELAHLEPFFQISRPGGAGLGSTLCQSYANKASLAVPFISLWNHHWAVGFGSLSTVFSIFVLPPFASAFFKVEVPELCWDELLVVNSDQIPYCYRSLLVVEWPARVSQAILVMIALFGIILFYVLWQRGNFLYAPITSIVGVAVLCQHAPFLEEMRLHASGNAEVDLSLMSCELKLVPGADDRPEPIYAIVFVPTRTSQPKNYFPSLSGLTSKVEAFYQKHNKEVYEYKQGVGQPQVVLQIGLMCVFWVYLAALFSFIVVYRFSKSFLDDFLDGDSAGIKVLVTFLSTIVQMFWGTVNRDIQSIVPYQNLAKRQAPPEQSIMLSYVHTVPGWTSIRSLFRHDFLVLLSSTATLFAEVLTIAIPAVPYNRAQTLKDSIYIGYVAVALSGIMLVILTVIIIIASRMKFRFTTQPSTVAGVITYLCQSSIIANLEGLSTATKDEVRTAVKRLKRDYGMGYSVGPDGVERPVIDEVAFLSRPI